MKKIVIIYHSGVGNTKKISEKMCRILKNSFEVEIYSLENIQYEFNFNNYDGIVIGFPVIHTSPSKRILEFIENIEQLKDKKPIYIFTTCAFYSANTLRIFAKKCIEKNIIPVLHNTYNGCPATDGTLLLPNIKRFFIFSKNIDDKISNNINTFIQIVNSNEIKINMPRFKIYSIPNYINKYIGKKITFQIYTHKNRCNKCSKCIKNCPVVAIQKDEFGYPNVIKNNCENCYRCIHHCPQTALSVSSKRRIKKTLNY